MIICDKCKKEITDGKYERLPYNDRNVVCESCYDKWIEFRVEGLLKLEQEFLGLDNEADKNGMPLPKRYGDLIDRDVAYEEFYEACLSGEGGAE